MSLPEIFAFSTRRECFAPFHSKTAPGLALSIPALRVKGYSVAATATTLPSSSMSSALVAVVEVSMPSKWSCLSSVISYQ
jgi:hypothetical protein